jgi:uncharacterized protein involved in type VI secretion and phage assembly
MGRSLFQKLAQKQRETAQAENWFTCVPAIVAINDDPEHQHRIKVIIPIIDEEQVHDEWVRQLGTHSGSGGYGSFYIPQVGQEVTLFSEFGQGENLFYLSVYNEDNDVPGDFADETTKGVRSDCDYKIITAGDFQIRAGSLKIEVDSTVEIIAPGGIFERGHK